MTTTKPTFKAGDVVLCVDAKEFGIPISEGSRYTIKRYVRNPGRTPSFLGSGKCPIPERLSEPGVTLMEVPGKFMARRFVLETPK